ncbi:primosomal protein N [Streptomyces himastatinicus ATCC 53653]|uniref:Probable replication restart protein PriA n=1 Tax=Streptomyces himastatinicus ATCC 53653 TaxID=457427 RepID=D9WPC6_9ACTN|nr:primosomal protein N' [Streptomyces himastatinicus]EFL21791.1 primosomal protein N [Streptomyces himastatinicus ATCC 53653]
MSRDDEQRKAPAEEPQGGEQLALIRDSVRKAKVPRAKPRTWRGAALAKDRPVAKVLVDKGPVHLDKLWDYAVPAEMDAEARPGVRVRVRFGAGTGRVREGRREGGGLLDGYIVDRVAESDYRGPLAAIAQVVSPEPVLGPGLLALCRAVADRYAGSLADVLQLAMPKRNVRAESETSPPPLPPPGPPEPGSWARYPAGPGFLEALAGGGTPRAVWTALPGPHWPDEWAAAVAATLASGRGALIVVPDGRTAARVDAALTRALGGAGRHVLLTADLGPEERYRRWLAVSRGSVRAVVGTRAAMFAPVRDLGLVGIWDDGDQSHSDDHAPQPHARDVLLLRAVHEKTGFLLGDLGRTVEAAQLVENGWARPLEADREQVRAVAPLIRTVDEGEVARDAEARAARLPTLAWQTVREALNRGPVLVQVPRRGYVPRLACERCREPARCRHCAGPLEARDADRLACGWCGRAETAWHCAECGGARLRASIVGARRTAEELGRAFPAVPVRTSGRDHVLDTVPDRPSLVVSTPGAEPVAEGGYAAALLLDGWALLGRPDLRAGEDALRRWLEAAALVRGQEDGGLVVVTAEPTQRPVQALVRWDPAGYAARELAERSQLGFPPVSRMAAVAGPGEAVAELIASAPLPEGTETLGPVPLPPTPPGRPRRPGDPPPGARWERALLRVPPGQGRALAAAVKEAKALRLARGDKDPTVRVDPLDIG